MVKFTFVPVDTNLTELEVFQVLHQGHSIGYARKSFRRNGVTRWECLNCAPEHLDADAHTFAQSRRQAALILLDAWEADERRKSA